MSAIEGTHRAQALSLPVYQRSVQPASRRCSITAVAKQKAEEAKTMQGSAESDDESCSEPDTEAEAYEAAAGKTTRARSCVIMRRRAREMAREREMMKTSRPVVAHSPPMWHAGPLPSPVASLMDVAMDSSDDTDSLFTGYVSDETTCSGAVSPSSFSTESTV